MRRRVLAASLLATTSACSLLVSTSGLTGGADDAGAADATPEAAIDAPPPPPPPPSQDAGADVDPSLLADWTFDEAAGIVAKDVTGHGYDATLGGDAAFQSTGHAGGSVKVDGAGFVRAMGVEAAVFPHTGTLSVWFRWDAENTAGDLNLVDNWDNTRAHVFIRHVETDPATQFQIALQPAMNAYSFAAGLDVTAATWTHLVVTWAEATRTGVAYANGVQLGAAPYDYDFVPSAEYFRLGELLIGSLDEVRIYTRALAPNEVAALP
ncbi:MAG TPA: LamG-like jellyroll fold domain-containing protein [Labilithrix sp.]